MLRTFVLGFLIAISVAQSLTPILQHQIYGVVSDPQIMKVVNPPGWNVVLETKVNTVAPNFVGYGAPWVWVNRTDRPYGFQITFESGFMSNCPDAPTTLYITADDAFTAYLNGVPIATGNNWTVKFNFTIYPQCGWNNFTVVATDLSNQLGAGLIFAIVQNQANCYQCAPSAFYDTDTCKCQCKKRCACQHKLQKWAGYPTCSCACTNRPFTHCTLATQFFNEGSCSCECLPKICPEHLEQDPQSCQCRCKQKTCEQGKKWSYSKCACIKKTCPYVATCQLPKIWDNGSCSCQCSTKPACSSHTSFDSNKCSCVSLQSQQDNN